ncbi:hypothetical protein MKZ38_010647 [Zalerion maritima]|uniref:Uncharacterized protein n=1 Tax=Zalerion maritima TaxID=339359 RepID=A0AAD5RTE8_9PEZI|nr:hypothetical protein MKZ38_010647 [Zalerion maritima]
MRDLKGKQSGPDPLRNFHEFVSKNGYFPPPRLEPIRLPGDEPPESEGGGGGRWSRRRSRRRIRFRNGRPLPPRALRDPEIYGYGPEVEPLLSFGPASSDSDGESDDDDDDDGEGPPSPFTAMGLSRERPSRGRRGRMGGSEKGLLKTAIGSTAGEEGRGKPKRVRWADLEAGAPSRKTPGGGAATERGTTTTTTTTTTAAGKGGRPPVVWYQPRSPPDPKPRGRAGRFSPRARTAERRGEEEEKNGLKRCNADSPSSSSSSSSSSSGRPVLGFDPREDHSIELLPRRPALKANVFHADDDSPSIALTQDDFASAFELLGDKISGWSRRFFLGPLPAGLGSADPLRRACLSAEASSAGDARAGGGERRRRQRGAPSGGEAGPGGQPEGVALPYEAFLWRLARGLAFGTKRYLASRTHCRLWVESFVWATLKEYLFQRGLWSLDARDARREATTRARCRAQAAAASAQEAEEAEKIDRVLERVEERKAAVDLREERMAHLRGGKADSGALRKQHREAALESRALIRLHRPGKALEGARDDLVREILKVLLPFRRCGSEVKGWDDGMMEIVDDALEFDILAATREKMLFEVVWPPGRDGLLCGQRVPKGRGGRWGVGRGTGSGGGWMDDVSIDEKMDEEDLGWWLEAQKQALEERGQPRDGPIDVRGFQALRNVEDQQLDQDILNKTRKGDKVKEKEEEEEEAAKRVTLVVRPALWYDDLVERKGGMCKVKMMVSTKVLVSPARVAEKMEELERKREEEEKEIREFKTRGLYGIFDMENDKTNKEENENRKGEGKGKEAFMKNWWENEGQDEEVFKRGKTKKTWFY